MIGAIRKRDIIAHPFVTLHCFGWRVFFRAVVAGREETFLSIVAQRCAVRPQPEPAFDLVRRCIELELRAKRMYEFLAHRFCERSEVKEFFNSLAEQEQEHASLLQLCSAAAGRERWTEECLRPLLETLPRIERRMQEAEGSLDNLEHLADALQFVIEVESSEINQIFCGVISANRSQFVARLRAFQEATARHLVYLCRRIKTLEPGLESSCERMSNSDRTSSIS